MVLERGVRRSRAPLPALPHPRAHPAHMTPRAAPDALTLTWVGHSTFLIQLGGLNILTDPMWSARASPLSFAGPRREAEPGISLDALPPIDVVLVSHNHYDHLDRHSVRVLAARDADAEWFAPLGVGAWLARQGVRRPHELDWHASARVGSVSLDCIPAQHFSGRSLGDRDASLWCGWVARSAGGRAAYFVGDTGLHPEFAAIGARHGPFDAVLMPIGAYDPRWFMRPVHLAPEEAVEAFRSLTQSRNGKGALMAGMHFATFRLTDEPLDEPPLRTRDAWQRAGLPLERLWIPWFGETRVVVSD